MKIKKKKLSIIAIVSVLLISLIVCIFEFFNIFNWNQIYNLFGVSDGLSDTNSYPLSVHFIDVGKADSIYIKCENKNILIDAGEKTTYNVVKEYLKRNNVKTLDLVVGTHPHSDHIGGLPEIINDFEVKKFMMPKVNDNLVPTSKCYERLLLALKNKNILAENPFVSQTFDIGELNFKVLSPKNENNYEKLNNFSIVLKMTYKDNSFLFTGDAETESENDMINTGLELSSDVLKIGHHGSKTSTSKAFLDRVNPTYAVICVADDRYNLPKKLILDRLTNKNIKIFRTDLDGTIVFASDGKNITTLKEKN